ncbi:MAG: hypothetical protein WBB34_07985 [Xanthobacteraceae bacterium]
MKAERGTAGSGHSQSNYSNGLLDGRFPNLASRTPLPRPTKSDDRASTTRGMQAAVLLSFELSARQRDQMLGELNDIGSADEAAKWARRRLPDKNKLNSDDAKHIEAVFRTKLLSFAAHHAEGIQDSTEASSATIDESPSTPSAEQTPGLNRAMRQSRQGDARDQNHAQNRSTNPF